MQLKSIDYIVFVFIVCVIYFMMQRTKYQKYILFVADCICVLAMSNATSLIMMVCTSAVAYQAGHSLERIDKADKKKRKCIMWIAVLFMMGILVFFKFFKCTYVALQGMMIENKGIHLPNLIVPMAISYYTLVLIGYVLEVYHFKIKAEYNFIDFLSVVLYFPSIVQGPINTYKHISPQLKVCHTFDWDRMVSGLQRLLWGYFKKVVVADRAGILVSGILQDESAGGFVIFYAIVIYSFQIYCDFSGGIDVIMGVSEILGIQLMENFKSPLVSKSVTEFWGAWHKSLGDWMERYVYYPIVLNKKVLKLSKKIPNKYLSKVFSATLASIVVFVIVGIWHGTGWNYVVYGVYQAFFVSTAVLLAPVYKRMKTKLHVKEQSLSWRILQIVRTFVILVFGRYFTRTERLGDAITLLARTFAENNLGKLFDGSLLNYGLDYKNMYFMYFCIVVVFFVEVLHDKNIHFRKLIMKQDIVFRYLIYFIGIFCIIIFGIYGPEFNTSAFIYQGF